MLAVPGERIGRRRGIAALWRADLGTMQVVIMPAIVEIGLEPMTDLETAVVRDGDIAQVK